MKIALSSGGRFHSIEIAKQLNRLKVDFTLYSGTTIPKEIPRDKVHSYRGIPLISFALRQVAFSERARRKITSLSDDLFDKTVASRISTDVDIFHGFSVYSLYTMRELKKKSVAKIVIDRGSAPVQEYNTIVEAEYNRLGKHYYWPDQTSIKKQDNEYSEADFILSPSSYVTDSLIKHKLSDREKIFDLPYGAPQVVKKEPKPEKFRVLFIGGAGIAKGLHYLIDAFSKLDCKNAELLVVGKIESDFPMKKANNVKFIRKLVGPALEEAFLSSSVLVLPSLSDGWGMVVTEAMAHGLPVIVSENSGVKDIVEQDKNGFIVPIKNSKSIQEKIQLLCDNPSKARHMGKNAKLTAAKNSWDKYGEELVKIYKKTLEF